MNINFYVNLIPMAFTPVFFVLPATKNRFWQNGLILVKDAPFSQRGWYQILIYSPSISLSACLSSPSSSSSPSFSISFSPRPILTLSINLKPIVLPLPPLVRPLRFPNCSYRVLVSFVYSWKTRKNPHSREEWEIILNIFWKKGEMFFSARQRGVCCHLCRGLHVTYTVQTLERAYVAIPNDK